MDRRRAFVLSCLASGSNVSELCRHYGISRKTGYKWLDRFESEGPAGLEDRSRAPHTHPRATSGEMRDLILEERGKSPGLGAGKILAVLSERYPDLPWPARSTVHEVLRRGGQVSGSRRSRSRLGGARRVVEADAPNAVWSADFKGEFRLGDGSLCYPLTVADGFSRYLLACVALESTKCSLVLPCFEALFRERGLPESILTDNGTPFGSVGAGGLTRLSVFWLKLGIVVDRTRPGHPQDNGRHERMHRTLKAATARPPSYSQTAQRARFDAFRQDYNAERPHEALGQIPPGRVYEASPRRWDGRVPEPEYPGHWEVRRVRTRGDIKWRGRRHFLSETLVGERVGLFESGDGVWQVAFGSHAVAVYLARDDRLHPIRPRARRAGPGHGVVQAPDGGQDQKPRPRP